MTHEERLRKAVEFNKRFVANNFAGQLVTRDLIRSDALSQEDIESLVELYPGYEVGRLYSVGDIFSQEGILYEVIQAHTSQADWLPSATPALYKSKAPQAVIPEFVQPTGAHDAYQIGDKVLFGGQVYESLINANAYSPTAYPAGWKLV